MIVAREMRPEEARLVVDYFHCSTPEHLEMLGVDPTRLPSAEQWTERIHQNLNLPARRRTNYYVVWLEDEAPFGFSSCDKIAYGEQAYMHLHVFRPERRRRGLGTGAVRQTVEIYFAEFALRRLFCEPNAFNVGPNRTLQSRWLSVR